MSENKEKKRSFRWLRWLVGGGLLLGLGAVGVGLLFPIALAQMALDRLKEHGVSGKVVEADIFSGVLRVRSFRLLRVQRETSFSLQASEGAVRLPIWRVLLGSRRLASVQVKQPQIRILRGVSTQDITLQSSQDVGASGGSASFKQGEASGGSASFKQGGASGVRAQVKRMQEAMKKFRSRLLVIERLEIAEGRMLFEQHQPQKIVVRVGSVEATLARMQGRVKIKQAEASVSMKKQTLSVQIPEGELALDVDALLAPSPALERVRLIGPAVRLVRSGPPDPPRDPVALRQTLTLLSPRLSSLVIEGGRFSMQHRLEVGRERDLQISHLQADLKDLQGSVRLRGFVLKSQEPHQQMRLEIPQADATIQMWPLLYGIIALDDVVAQKPIFTLHFLKKRTHPPRHHRKPPWLQMRHAKVQEGEVRLHFTLRDRKDPSKPPRRVQIQMNRVQADVRDLDIRYLLARPFSAEGSAWVLGHGGVRFSSQKQAEHNHRLIVHRIPSTLLNRFIDQQKTPLQINKGLITARLDLSPRSNERTRIQAQFRVHQLDVGVVKQNKQVFKKALFGILSGIVNQHVRKLPNGYALQTGFSVDSHLLADMNPRLMQMLSRRFLRGFLDALIEKHPILRPFQKGIQRNAGLIPKDKPKGLFARWREERKKRREERRKRW
ncbi:hypothetical protein L6R29_02350 [Myxococcota bacterium]|nr:hypothetical protein [Myxococcota bacterium]